MLLQLEKMNRQKEYAEKVRRQLADQTSRPRVFSRERIRSDSAASSLTDYHRNKTTKLPSIVVALPKDPRAEAIAKREKVT